MRRRQLNIHRLRSRGFLKGLLLAGLLISPATAQHQQHHQPSQKDTTQSEPGMMTGHMHGGDQAMMGMMGQGTPQDHMQAMHQMMARPVMRTMMMTTAIPAMKEALDLSDDQIRRLDEVSESLQQERKDLTARIEETEKTLRGQIGNLEDADPDALGSLVRKRASLVGDLQASTLRSAMRMHGVLTADQRTKLASMDSAQMHKHMMSHMSEMEMMKAMRSIMMTDMSCPMMNRMSGMSHGQSTYDSN